MFTMFGDESTCGKSTKTVIYASFLILDSKISIAENILADLKIKYGIDPDAELHCRILFAGHKKSKSQWKNLSEKQCFAFLRELIDKIKKLHISFSVGGIHKTEFKNKIEYTSIKDRKQKQLNVGTKALTSLAFQASVTPLLNALGSKNISLYIDPDTTKIPWFDGNIQIQRTYKINLRKEDGSVDFIEPTNLGETHRLLEISDLLAYVAGRALAPEPTRNNEAFEELYRMISPLLNVFSGESYNLPISQKVLSGLELQHSRICSKSFLEKSESQFSCLPIGFAIWGLKINTKGSNVPSISLRVPNQFLANQPRCPQLDIRFGALKVQKYPIYAFLIRLNDLDCTFYSFLNFFRGVNDSPFLYLISGSSLIIDFHNDTEKSYSHCEYDFGGHPALIGIQNSIMHLPEYNEDEFFGKLAKLGLSPDEIWNKL